MQGVKSVRIRSYSCLHFSALRLNTERYSVSLPPYSARMRENAHENNSEYGHFLRSDGCKNIHLICSIYAVVTFKVHHCQSDKLSCYFFCYFILGEAAVIFFSIRVFFHRHWRFTGQQKKWGNYLLFLSTTSALSQTFRHLLATLHVVVISHCTPCSFHLLKKIVFSPSFWPRREYTWTFFWKKSLMNCFKNCQGIPYSHRQSRKKIKKTLVIVNIDRLFYARTKTKTWFASPVSREYFGIKPATFLLTKWQKYHPLVKWTAKYVFS